MTIRRATNYEQSTINYSAHNDAKNLSPAQRPQM